MGRKSLLWDPEILEVLRWYFRDKIKSRCPDWKKAGLTLFYRQVKPTVAKEYPALRVSCGKTRFVIHLAQAIMDSLPYLRMAYRLKNLREKLEEVVFGLQRIDLKTSPEVAEEALKLLEVYNDLTGEMERVKKFLKEAEKKGLL